MRNILNIILILCCFNSYAADYYFSSTTGNDSRTSAQAQNSATPWQSISKLNSFFSTLVAGDHVYFLRGDTFIGTITATKSGTSGNPITIGAYGTGNQPIITGFTTITGWTNEGSGIYSKVITSSQLTNMVTIDGVQYAMGRYPDAAYLTYESATPTTITDNELTATPNWTGAEAVIRKNDFAIDRTNVTAQSGGTLTFVTLGSGFDPTAGFGFFIQNDLRTLSTFGEWYHNVGTGKFYMYFGAIDPTTKVVNVATVNNLFSVTNFDFITLDNINFKGSIDNALNFANDNDNCIVQNCTISFGGKSAIAINDANCIADVVNNNIINWCNSYGVFTVGTSQIISNNTITDIGRIVGQSLGNGATYTAISVAGLASNVHHNIIRRTGDYGIYIRASGAVTVQYNLVDSACLIYDDGAGIYTSAADASIRLIDHNIILRTVGNSQGTRDNQPISVGIYLDEHASNVWVTNNTMDSTSLFGIKIHYGHDNVITDNTTFYHGYSIDYEDGTGNLMRNNSMRRNIFCAVIASQFVMNYYTVTNDIALFGTADSNYYARPIDDNLDFRLHQPSFGTGYINNSLAGWQSLTSQDLHSKKAPKTITNPNQLHFTYNASDNPITTTFTGFSRIDMRGTVYLNSATVPAWNSIILFDSGLVVPNTLPTADAGPDKTITMPTSSTTVSGGATTGSGSTLTYRWVQIGGPTTSIIGTPNASSTNISNLNVQGTYTFRFSAKNNLGDSAVDFMQVFVNASNIAPTANAGTDQSVTLPTSSTTLTGSGTDPDGTIVTYFWSKISGPTGGNITSPNSSTTGITSLQQGTYVYQLIVTDNNGLTGSDFVQVVVNAANINPTANAGSDQSITLPTSTTTLTGSGSDPDGSIVSYLWTRIGGPAGGTITSPNSSSTGITALQQGTYVYQLTVTDNGGLTGSDIIQVVVNPANVNPTANAGIDQSITLPTNSTTLNGSGNDPDGSIVSVLWTKISGPAGGTITSSTSLNTSVTSLQQGTYVYQLTVTDNKGATGTDFMQILVNPAVPPVNIPPTANAGVDQNKTLPTNTATLSGSGNDPDGSIVAYLWTKISGPTGGAITSPTLATTGVTGLLAGSYFYQLRVTDNSGDTATDVMQITVNAANVLPTANAGVDQSITSPTSTTTLTGSGTDPDGTITGYLWRKISGPTGGVITSSTSSTTGITGLVVGTYVYQLRVTDNSGDTATDAMQVVVNAANIKPTANAGPDQGITLPTSSTTLTGSGTDPDGTITAFLWTKISGTGGSITSSTSATTGITGLSAGVYIYRLRVTDNAGDTAIDAVQITVTAANILPTANAGTDQVITLPVNTVNLSGSGNDPDGTITAYEWTQKAGPTIAVISAPNNASTSITGMVQGNYIFQLKVTGSAGISDTATDAVQVIVNAQLIPPTANVQVNQTVQLPFNQTTLVGSGTAYNGATIISYSWTDISGNPSAGTIQSPNASSTIVTPLIEGIYRYQLTVTDSNGNTGSNIIQVTVIAALPPNIPALLRIRN